MPGPLVSFRSYVHPSERHGQGRVSPRRRRARSDHRLSRYQPARRETSQTRATTGSSDRARAFISMPRRRLSSATIACRATSSTNCPRCSRKELPADMDRQGIFGHSMGGHGAITLALKNPGRFRYGLGLCPDRTTIDRRLVEASFREISRARFEARGGRMMRRASSKTAIAWTSFSSTRAPPTAFSTTACDHGCSRKRARRRHRADAEHARRLRPFLFHHFDFHGRSPQMACRATSARATETLSRKTRRLDAIARRRRA